MPGIQPRLGTRRLHSCVRESRRRRESTMPDGCLGGNLKIRAYPRTPRSYNRQASVPILPRPVIQDRKGVGDEAHLGGKMVSIVRLYIADEIPTSPVSGAIFRMLTSNPHRCIIDRQLTVLFVGWRLPPCLANSSLIDARIQRGAELVQHLARFDAEHKGNGSYRGATLRLPVPSVFTSTPRL